MGGIVFNPLSDVSSDSPILTSDAWAKWGRDKGRLFAVEYGVTPVRLFLANPDDQTVYYITNFEYPGIVPCYRSVSSVLVGSLIYMIGAVESNQSPTAGSKNVYFCDLEKLPECQWKTGPCLNTPKLFPLLLVILGRIYALDVETHQKDPQHSFEGLDVHGGIQQWQQLPGPPFLENDLSRFQVDGIACVRHQQFVVQVYVRFDSSGRMVDTLEFHCFCVDKCEWSLLRRLGIDWKDHGFIPRSVAPYRVYVTDIAPLLSGNVRLDLFDFSSNGNARASPIVHGHRYIRWRESLEWHLYQSNGSETDEFCLLYFCVGCMGAPAVSVCTFSLCKRMQPLEPYYPYTFGFASDYDSDDDGDEVCDDSESDNQPNKSLDQLGEEVEGYIFQALRHKLNYIPTDLPRHYPYLLPETSVRNDCNTRDTRDLYFSLRHLFLSEMELVDPLVGLQEETRAAAKGNDESNEPPALSASM